MIKIIGIMCLLVGFLGLSMEMVKDETEKLKRVKDIRNFVHFLLGEMQYSHIPIPDICREYTERCDGWLLYFLEKVCTNFEKNKGQSFEMVWQKEVEKTEGSGNRFCRDTEDIKWLKRLYKCFGYDNLGTQEMGIVQYLDELDKFIIQKEKRFKDNKKLILYFGVMSGLLLSIILL